MAPREIERLVGIVEQPPPAAPSSSPAAEQPTAATAQPAAAAAPLVAQEPVDPADLPEEQRIGRRLVRIRRKKKEALTDADYLAMRDAVTYIRRHTAHPPKNEEKLEEWRRSLMARGFDPDKAQGRQPIADC
jgi:hypothetical protein